jgi:hypothetical protein
VLGGGLEPHFRVLFSAIFHGVSPGISIRGGKLRNRAERKLYSIVVSLRTTFLAVCVN